MSLVKTTEEVEKMRISASLLSRCLDTLVSFTKPGTLEGDVDTLAEEFIRDHGAIPAFKGYSQGSIPGFPSSICFSKNSTVVHGIPKKDKVIDDGDMVTIDCGLSLDGWFADAARLFGVGNISDKDKDMIDWSEKVLQAGVDACVVGNRLGDICYAIQIKTVHSPYYGVIEFTGHAIGQAMHEAPQVPNFGRKGTGPRLKPGMVFCLEPMLKETTTGLGQMPDLWTIITLDKTRATHIEDMVLVTEDKPEILTAKI